jgi:hypothetical protein
LPLIDANRFDPVSCHRRSCHLPSIYFPLPVRPFACEIASGETRRGGTMIKPALQVESATSSWNANPVHRIGRLVDKFLDHIEQTSRLVLQVPADRPAFVKIKARVDQYPP